MSWQKSDQQQHV